MTSSSSAPEGLVAERMLSSMWNSQIDPHEASDFMEITTPTSWAAATFVRVAGGNASDKGSVGLTPEVVVSCHDSGTTCHSFWGRAARKIAVVGSGEVVEGNAPSGSNRVPLQLIWPVSHFGGGTWAFAAARAAVSLLGEHVRTSSVWIGDVLHELEALPRRCAAEGQIEPKKEAIAYAIEVSSICALLSFPRPTVDCDEEGNIELFFKVGTTGILLVIWGTGVLQVLGNEAGQKWRARYALLGSSWKKQFRAAMKAVIDP